MLLPDGIGHPIFPPENTLLKKQGFHNNITSIHAERTFSARENF